MLFSFSLSMPTLPDLLERAKLDAGLSDKEIQFALGYRHQSDWSKTKHGVRHRPFPLKALVESEDPVLVRYREAIGALLTAQANRDLLLSLITEVRKLKELLGFRTQAKAELRERAERECA